MFIEITILFLQCISYNYRNYRLYSVADLEWFLWFPLKPPLLRASARDRWPVQSIARILQSHVQKRLASHLHHSTHVQTIQNKCGYGKVGVVRQKFSARKRRG